MTSLLLPHFSSFLTDSLPSLNFLCHSKTDARFMQDGRKAVWSISCVSVAFLTSLKHNFIAYRSSKVSDCIFKIHQLWQFGFSRVYSNSCCSCSFEPEIIKIGPSSQKMYSNNLLNFQEFGTILNARTKKSGNLLNTPPNKRKAIICFVFNSYSFFFLFSIPLLSFFFIFPFTLILHTFLHVTLIYLSVSSSKTYFRFSHLPPKIWLWHQTSTITHLTTFTVWGHSDTPDWKYNLQEKRRKWRIGSHICFSQITLLVRLFLLSPFTFLLTYCVCSSLLFTAKHVPRVSLIVANHLHLALR